MRGEDSAHVVHIHHRRVEEQINGRIESGKAIGQLMCESHHKHDEPVCWNPFFRSNVFQDTPTFLLRSSQGQDSWLLTSVRWECIPDEAVPLRFAEIDPMEECIVSETRQGQIKLAIERYLVLFQNVVSSAEASRP